jgi:membrane protease YdiL (CAAX protease family)
MTAPDLLCLTLIAFVLLFDHFVVWRAFLRRSQVDPTRARLWLYRALVGELWAMAACVLALWLYQGRPWALLRLSALHGWRLWTSLALVSAVAATLAAMIVRLARLRRRKRVKIRSQAVAHAPHTRRELAWWAAVSLSAGFSEELIFRGFLLWAFQPLVGLWGAAALSLIVFAAAHAYQGAAGALAVGIVGAFLTLVVLIFGSLWPAVALHLLMDLQQGFAAWLVLQKEPEPTPVVTPPAPSGP